METIDRFVRLGTVGDAGTAHICAARLESEGIEVRLRGESLGPYPVTVGQMAATELWVLGGRLEEASRILLESEVDFCLGGLLPDGEDAAGRPNGVVPQRLVAVGVAAALLLGAAVALLSVL